MTLGRMFVWVPKLQNGNDSIASALLPGLSQKLFGIRTVSFVTRQYVMQWANYKIKK